MLTSISGLPLAQTLDIYFIDVEGGAATLIVTPERESVLVDSGWRRVDGRDAKRIHRLATEQASITQIDYLITTHYHRDHYGGVGLLSGMLPIQNFLDHRSRQLIERGSRVPILLYGIRESEPRSAAAHPSR